MEADWPAERNSCPGNGRRRNFGRELVIKTPPLVSCNVNTLSSVGVNRSTCNDLHGQAGIGKLEPPKNRIVTGEAMLPVLWARLFSINIKFCNISGNAVIPVVSKVTLKALIAWGFVPRN